LFEKLQQEEKDRQANAAEVTRKKKEAADQA
jgi:hypothetical protein